MNVFVASDGQHFPFWQESCFMKVPEIDEEILKKLPYWKQWLYRTAKELSEEGEHGR